MHINNYERFANGATTTAQENGDAKMKDGKKKGKNAGDDSDNQDSDGNNKDSEEEDFEDLMSMLPLPEGVLKVNLGIPIVVACHKVDLIGRGDKAQFLE